MVRVIQRSPSLTSVTLHQSSCLALPEVLSAGKATDLAGRLRELRGLCIVRTDTMLHQLQQCTGLQHLEVRGRIQHLSNKQQAVQALCDALKHLPSLTYLSLVPRLSGRRQFSHRVGLQRGIGNPHPAAAPAPG